MDKLLVEIGIWFFKKAGITDFLLCFTCKGIRVGGFCPKCHLKHLKEVQV